MRFLSKLQTTITPVNFLKLTSPSLFLSLTVDIRLIISLYGSMHKDVYVYLLNQGRRRLLKSGPAMKGSRVPKARVGGEHERGRFPPLVRGVGGFSPEKILYFRTSVETILMHFETIFET